MSIQATEGGSSLFAPPTSAPSGKAAEDKQMFLELLVAQLRYQDPLNPTDSGEFLAQSAQFTALEKMQAVADQTALLASSQLAFGASGLVGRHVEWTDETGATLEGTVRGVSFSATGPVLDVDGTEVPIAQISSVTEGPASGSGSSPTTSSTASTEPTDPAA